MSVAEVSVLTQASLQTREAPRGLWGGRTFGAPLLKPHVRPHDP